MNWDEAIRKTYERSRKLGVPNINYEDGYVIFSVAYMTAISFKKLYAIDAGAGVGFSTVWVIKALRNSKVDGKIYAIEEEPRRFNYLRELVENYNFQDIVIPIKGDALENVKKIEDLNFVFIDIDKHLYLDFFNLVKDKVKVGGVVLAHNVNYTWGTIREFLEEASKGNWRTAVVPTSEGISISLRVA